ncbi:hypothetical protein JXA80_08445, partial [bacterium]|nr:hypothetical protein [candidate division CSSED10-310 bacterium]
ARIHQAPDIVAIPSRGIELKSRFAPGPLVQPSRLTGMHTFDDALVWFRQGKPTDHAPGIIDMYPTIMQYFGLDPGAAQGTCFIHW